MKCRKCKHQLKNDAKFCGRCGAKSPLFKLSNLSNLLKVTAILDIIFLCFGPIFEWSWSEVNSRIAIKIIGIYIAVIVIMFAKNYTKTSFVKSRSIAYLLLIVVNVIIHLFILNEYPYPVIYFYWLRVYWVFPLYLIRVAYIFFTLIPSCIIPTLYIIFTSKLQKMYLQSKEDD